MTKHSRDKVLKLSFLQRTPQVSQLSIHRKRDNKITSSLILIRDLPRYAIDGAGQLRFIGLAAIYQSASKYQSSPWGIPSVSQLYCPDIPDIYMDVKFKIPLSPVAASCK